VTLGVAVFVAAVLGAAGAAVLSRWLSARRAVAMARQVDPLAPSTSDPDRALGHLVRVAERATSDAALLSARAERLRRALDGLPQGILVADDLGVVLMRNAAATRFLGVRTADVLIDDAVLAMLRSALATGEQCSRLLELFGPPRRTVVITAAPFGEDTDAHGAVVEIEDITDRARLEAMRRDFMANISHELKTPVGALSLLAETLADEDDPALMNRLAGKMVIEAHRVNRIIDDLLELSRIEVEEKGGREPVVLGLVTAEAVDRVRHVAMSRDIHVVVAEPSRRLSVLGDRRQLVSALGNLLENAVKYSDPGSSVDLAARSDGQWVDIVVTDHGIGIPARDLDRIFERFYRVDRARSRETGGTGLGLAIVRHVATNHGGTVSVQSQEGVGSTFTLRVPAGPGPVAVDLPEAG
jgi:two-component system sensor histidine kinase SenX3